MVAGKADSGRRADGVLSSAAVVDDAGQIARACVALQAGKLVVVPTETVYGLAACADDDAAVAAIFVAKGRPSHNPLIVHVADVEAAHAIATFDLRAERLAAAFWPGPLTLVLPRRADAAATTLSPRVTAGLPTVAVRVPDHPLLQALLRRLGRPLAAPSANRSGRLSATCAADAAVELMHGQTAAAVAMVIDGGPSWRGLESTIVAVDDDGCTLLRPGALPIEAIEAVVGPLRTPAAGAPVRAPGALLRHYAPSLPLRLNVVQALPYEAHIVFGCGDGAAEDAAATSGTLTYDLSPSGSLDEAARNLFATLRRADDPLRARGIAVAPLPQQGLGVAIADRLTRAAAASLGDVSWLVLDLGGVVVRIARTFAERCVAAGLPLRPGCDGDAALEACAGDIDALQRGAGTTTDVAAALAVALHGVYGVAELERLYEAQILGPYQGVADIVARASVPRAILSNTSAGHWPLLLQSPVVAAATRRFASFELGVCKPDLAIFDHVANALGEVPGRLLLLDDSEINVLAARAAGWQAVRIDPDGDVAAQIEGLLAARGLLRDP